MDKNGVQTKIKYCLYTGGQAGIKAESSPICAAVTCLRDVHFGHLILEVATLFYVLPEPLVRSTYLVFMMQNYCHVLTLTLEMLHVTDWPVAFKSVASLPKVLEAFFQVLPQAILAAVEVCMEQTDPQELSSLVSDGGHSKAGGNFKKAKIEEAKFANQFVPLTESRIQFLVRLMDAVKKPF